MATHDSTINRDSQAYWNKRATTFTRDATSDYERWLMDLLALTEGEEVLDMGCATGTLAAPPALAPREAGICAARLTRTVDDAAHDGNLDGIFHSL